MQARVETHRLLSCIHAHFEFCTAYAAFPALRVIVEVAGLLNLLFVCEYRFTQSLRQSGTNRGLGAQFVIDAIRVEARRLLSCIHAPFEFSTVYAAFPALHVIVEVTAKETEGVLLAARLP